MSRALAGAFAVALVALGLSLAASADSRGSGDLRLRAVGEFDSPVYVAAPPRDRHRLFVVERAGRIVVMRDGGRPRTFLDISERVSTQGERGLLSMAFAPNYGKSRRFYVYYSNDAGDIEVDEFRRSGRSGSRAAEGSRRRIVAVPHSGAFHNGGTVAFGPDGGLYAAIGENGMPSNAQDPSTPLGKLIELDPRRPGRIEIVATGLRNPFRFSFDDRTETIAIGDVGAGSVEEVDYLALADARGANFGWPAFEGDVATGSALVGGPPAPPMFTYDHSGGRCSITGGLTVRDRRLGALAGRYLYADLCAGELRSFEPDVAANAARDERSLGITIDQPVGFGADGRDRVHVASLDGTVYRLAGG
ncbi:MAG TPA: PQQ-dependent sugar dehydrogenase [Solirubrobacterales bacterium]